MTRAKEITKEAKKFAKEIDDWEIAEDVQDAFEQGARWADAHPDIDVRTMTACWISVEDELPNNYERVIAAFGRHFARICFHCGDTWYLDNPPVAEPMSGITHWMPLPQPPKEGGKE